MLYSCKLLVYTSKVILMYNSQLDVFISVADCGSFAKAAEKLYVSSTAVMKQMNLLESHLGIKLFLRTNHGVKLTSAGESIYMDAKYMISYSEKAIKKAENLTQVCKYTFCIGTSMLNPCKVFMDLWYKISNHFPQFKINIVPFEDDHNGILSEISSLGEKYDFLVAACDSIEWLKRCNFFPLGEYKRCCAVPRSHRLASKSEIQITDLYGETFMMVERGDSPSNDRVRDELEKNHPQINIEDTPNFYDIEVFNDCVQKNYILSSLECWNDIHPSLINIPINWGDTIPYGLLYAHNPIDDILDFIEAIKSI